MSILSQHFTCKFVIKFLIRKYKELFAPFLLVRSPKKNAFAVGKTFIVSVSPPTFPEKLTSRVFVQKSDFLPDFYEKKLKFARDILTFP